jgi:hypothetical protein
MKVMTPLREGDNGFPPAKLRSRHALARSAKVDPVLRKAIKLAQIA